jgi:glycosyltransferase involved in cell wall biosynthesis
VISVIVPVRDVAATLPAQLDALARQTYPGPWELLVVDNGSTDATVTIARDARARLPQLRVVDAGRVPGVSRARNAGIAAATGDFLVFADGDDLVADDWLARMADAAATCDFVAGVVDRARFTHGPGADPARARSSARIPFPGFLPFAMGANFGVRARVVAEVGAFDETYAGGGEDPDFSWRVQLAGHELCEADAVTHYRERARLRDLARQFYRYGVSDPHLFREFRDRGMARPAGRAVARGWAHLVVRAPWYWSHPARRRQWVRSVARRVGRLAGSARYRVRYC